MKRFSKSKNDLRQVRHTRVRARVLGTEERPRLSVFRGLTMMEAQLINDEKGVTLCSATTRELKGDAGERKAKVAAGYLLGKSIAEQAKQKGISKVVFDRGGYRYHGRIAAVAEGAREGGLEF
jgi:large subunit ribosomal protein L18